MAASSSSAAGAAGPEGQSGARFGMDTDNRTRDAQLNAIYIALFTRAYSGVSLGGEPDRSNDHEKTETQRQG